MNSAVSLSRRAALGSSILGASALGLGLGQSAFGQSLTYEPQPKTHWRVGLILDTPVTCTNIRATFPVPTNWPEQTVTVRSQKIDPRVSGWKIRELGGGTKQVYLQMGQVIAGSTASFLYELEIERSRILPPDNTDSLVIPKKIPRELRLYMGNSPFIDASSRLIRSASKEVESMEAENAWHRVELAYDWVRDHVEYTEGELTNASVALKNGKGDCEEMTSLFVAICRNLDIPARMVWIPDHCYPEFYLEDADGNGTWYPCQAAGTRQFGRMDETRPVLQKGDRFRVPEKKGAVRYVSEFFQCDRKGKANPNPNFVRERVDV